MAILLIEAAVIVESIPVRPGVVVDLPPLEYVRDLAYYDGPITAEYRSADGTPYIWHWLDSPPAWSSWIVFRTTRGCLQQYLADKVSPNLLLILLAGCPDSEVVVCDVDSEGNVCGSRKILRAEVEAGMS